MGDAEEHQHYDLHRLIVLSDAVFAIAMTLLALELRPPATWDGSIASLWTTMSSSLLAYGLSFLMIGGYWLSHTRIFRHFARADRGVILLSILGLGLVTLLPVGTRLVIDHRGGAGAETIYLSLIGSIGVLNAVIWGYGAMIPSMMHPNVTKAQKIRRFIGLALAPLAAAGVSFLAFLGQKTGM